MSRRRTILARAVERQPVADPFHHMAEMVEGRELRIDELSDSILADMFEGTFGKPPHHRMKRETIVARLNDTSNQRA